MRHPAFQDVIHWLGSPLGAEETLSRIVTVRSSDISRSLPSTSDGVGLLLIDIFRARETSVVGVILQGQLARGGVGASFNPASPSSSTPTSRDGLEGEAGPVVVALKKPFHNPDCPLYKVPRTGTTSEPAEASTGGRWLRFGDEDMREIASRSEIPSFLDLGLIGVGEGATGDGASRVFSETPFSILSRVSELSRLGNGV